MGTKEIIDLGSLASIFPCDELKQIRALNSLALVDLCANDPANFAAWHEFTSRFISSIRVFISRARHSSSLSESRTLRWPDLEDLVQEVIMRLVANDCQLLKRFEWRTEASFFRYLSMVSSSVVIDCYRYLQRQRRPSHDSCLEEIDPALLDRIGLSRDDLKMEKSILLQEITQIVEDLLREEIAEAETRDRYFLIFKLHLFEGMSLSQISRHYGVNLSKKGVDKVLATILKRLRERLTVAKG